MLIVCSLLPIIPRRPRYGLKAFSYLYYFKVRHLWSWADQACIFYMQLHRVVRAVCIVLKQCKYLSRWSRAAIRVRFVTIFAWLIRSWKSWIRSIVVTWKPSQVLNAVQVGLGVTTSSQNSRFSAKSYLNFSCSWMTFLLQCSTLLRRNDIGV